MKRLLLVVAALLSALVQAQDPNLARTAHASASESQSSDLSPEKATDENIGTRWSGIPGHNSGVWFELRWDEPVTVGEVVVRQYQRYSEEWDLQIWDGSGYRTLQHFGKKGERLPNVVLARFSPITTTRVRIANITNGPSFTEVEVYAKEYQHPPALKVASDLQGNFIGMLTDSIGAVPGAHVKVTMSGEFGAKEAETDDHGLFTFPMPIHEDEAISFKSANGAVLKVKRRDFPYSVTPLSSNQPRTSLDGQWKFELDPPEDFMKPEFDDSKWSAIQVPGHWEMQGFRSLDGIGGYRRPFDVPQGSGRLTLRFDGVYSGAEVWINGQHATMHEGGFTPFETDITDLVHEGSNTLAVKVREHTNVSDNLDKMSQYADFPLAGITRKVYLFRCPDTHIVRYTSDTTFDENSASLRVSAFAVRSLRLPSPERGDGAGGEVPGAIRLSGTSISARLISPGGTTVATSASTPVEIPDDGFAQGKANFNLKIDHPLPWTAESPNLYTLNLELRDQHGVIQRLDQKVGLRQTTIKGSQLLINGSTVKIRGTCHHDADPLMGRAVTVERTKQDLEMIREANLNAVRTSHYPPIPELIDIADELGLYVEDEADFCWVGVADDLRNTPTILQLTAELLARDRNHPSVFMWSLCNESDFGYGFERSHEWVRQSDPSRPDGAATSSWLEIATLHNPITIKRMDQEENLDKPLLFDEAWCIYQGIFNDVAEMWVDPGIRDYYAEPLQAIYRKMMDSKVTQGSQIWCWADDIFAVPGRGLEYGRGTTMSHFIDDQYAIPGRGLVGDAPWGVVDGWRRRKPEFWITKKLQSPIKIQEGPLPNSALTGTPSPERGEGAGGEVPEARKAAVGHLHTEVRVENQYDFTNLRDVKITYAVGKQHGAVVADIRPHSTGTITVEPPQPVSPGDILDLKFEYRGLLVDEYRLGVPSPARGEGAGGEVPRAMEDHRAPLRVQETSVLAGNGLEILGQNFDLLFDKDSGALRRCFSNGQPTLLELPQLHILPTESPTLPIPQRTDWNAKSFAWSKEGDDVRVSIKGSYPGFDGGYDVLITPAGEMTVHSNFKYSGAERLAREIGLAFSVPRACDTLHWERNAEWSVYPDDHIGRPVGTTKALADHGKAVPPRWSWAEDNSPMGSNDFRSTKRHIRSAWIAYPVGSAVEITSDGNQSLRAMVDTDRIVVNVNDWYGGTNVGWGEWISNYGRGKTIKSGDVLESLLKLRLTEKR